MELHPAAKRTRQSLHGAAVRRTGLSMYTQAPQVEISMSELEQCCYMRLRLLRRIDHLRAKGIRGADLEKEIAKAERNIMRESPLWSDDEVQRDQCSHFMLRLAFCRSEDLRRYLLSNEHELFKFRFSTEPGDLLRFLRDNGLCYEPISDDHLDKLKPELRMMQRRYKGRDAAAAAAPLEVFYRVPFEEVLDLVRAKRVLLREGFAYVPHSDLVSIVGGQFRSRLSKSLAEAAQAWPALKEAEADRLLHFLEHCSTQYMVDDYTTSKKASGHSVDLAELPALSKRSFPPCMQTLNSKLAESSHLRHQGRIQLGLFLKGIGLTYDESYAYWKANFVKNGKMTAEKFDKEHRYNIRYNYGLEGQKKSFSALGCSRVIATLPSAGEHHGCPFRNLSRDDLSQLILSHGVKRSDANQILDKAKEHHFQVACGLYFEARHANSTLTQTEVGGITHPNEYFDLSMKFYAELHAHPHGQGAAAPAAETPKDPGAVKRSTEA